MFLYTMNIVRYIVTLLSNLEKIIIQYKHNVYNLKVLKVSMYMGLFDLKMTN